MFGKLLDSFGTNMIKTKPQRFKLGPWSGNQRFEGLIAKIVMS